jgi:hypothetical protein
MDRKCLTPGAIYHTSISNGKVTIVVDCENQHWNEQTSAIIEERLHDGVEAALAPFWDNNRNESQKSGRLVK